ncbi:hypothetical protein FS749_003070 [Ceratobasidium sp. UAMH 11750]|nr:hypothetical protein FS749_003070 [Ceratobasidium sp. UAMH 11750]
MHSEKATACLSAESPPTSTPAPRIVYVRDLGVAGSWASQLLRSLAAAAYHPIVVNGKAELHSLGPMALVYGLTPTPPNPDPPISGTRRFNLANSSRYSDDDSDSDCSSHHSLTSAEGETANKLRADRLRGTMKRWRADRLLDQEISRLQLDNYMFDEFDFGSSRNRRQCFGIRSCVVVPESRDLKQERNARENRRQELTELRVRVALGAMGVKLASSVLSLPGQASNMLKRWRSGLVEAKTLSQVIDCALADLSTVSTQDQQDNVLPWSSLCAAWGAHMGHKDQNMDLIQKYAAVGKTTRCNLDPVVRRVKRTLLTQDERNLLCCLINPAQMTTTFDQVHHPESTIDRLHTLVSLPLLFPAHFQTGFLKSHSLGGALLFGPPGTGKTLVAQAIAKESGSRMLAIKPSDIVDKCHGHSEKLIIGLFKLARQLTPCIIFMDEIDGLLGTRIYQKESNSGHWHASMLTEFMQEMDGLTCSDVLVIGATNRPFALDEAILRRLPHRIMIDLPKRRARREILKILLREEAVAPDVNLRDIARETKRFSGSDLKALCVSAALMAAKEGLKLPWRTDSNNCQLEAKSDASPLTPASEGGCETWLSQCDAAATSTRPEDDATSVKSCRSNGSNRLTTDGACRVKPCVQADNERPVTGRVISNRHFRMALKENKATACESSCALQELRRWGKRFSGQEPQSEKCNSRRPVAQPITVPPPSEDQ